jgi:hypothetical protein
MVASGIIAPNMELFQKIIVNGGKRSFNVTEKEISGKIDNLRKWAGFPFMFGNMKTLIRQPEI